MHSVLIYLNDTTFSSSSGGTSNAHNLKYVGCVCLFSLGLRFGHEYSWVPFVN